MNAILHGQNVIDSLMSEEKYLDTSIVESLYAIRKLKGLVSSISNGGIVVGDANEHGQRFCEKFNVWFNENEMKII